MCFGPKNVEKLRFLGVFMSALRVSENSLFISNDIQMHKTVVYLDAQDVATIKQIIFSRKKKQLLGRKSVKERCFSVFSDIAPLKSLVILLHCSDYSQTNRIAGRSNLEGGKKIEAQNSVLFVFTFAIFSRVRQS